MDVEGFQIFESGKKKLRISRIAGYAHNIIYISILALGDQYEFIQIENIIH